MSQFSHGQTWAELISISQHFTSSSSWPLLSWTAIWLTNLYRFSHNIFFYFTMKKCIHGNFPLLTVQPKTLKAIGHTTRLSELHSLEYFSYTSEFVFLYRNLSNCLNKMNIHQVCVVRATFFTKFKIIKINFYFLSKLRIKNLGRFCKFKMYVQQSIK